jgi:hypothetical protein
MRPRSVSAIAFNIALNPHSKELYKALFSRLLRLRKAYRITGDRFAMLVSAHEETRTTIEGMTHEEITGEIVTFDKVDVEGHWHNLVTGEVASDEDKAGLFVPPNLGANRKSFSYVFYLDRHLLVVESKNVEGTISSRSVLTLLDALARVDSIVEEFGDVAVTPMPDHEAVSRILRHRLVRVDIKLTIPNPDSTQSAEERIRERLSNQNAKTQLLTLVAKSGQTLDLDEDSKALARLASRNGEVKAKTASSPSAPARTVSTKTMPMVKTERYFPKEELESAAFSRAAALLYSQAVDQSDDDAPKG